MSREPGTAPDWNQVIARLQASTLAVGRGSQLTVEQRRALLHQRAIDLAQTEAVTPLNQHLISVLGFRLGTRDLALDASVVSEVYPYRDIVQVPCTPPHILGLINARGQILSVTDLKVFMGIPPVAPTLESKIVLLTTPTLEFGVLVDALHDIREIVVESLTRPVRDAQSVDFVFGTTPDGVTVIDVQRLLADRRLVIGE